jgi:AcrR family transcriptional regulator
MSPRDATADAATADAAAVDDAAAAGHELDVDALPGSASLGLRERKRLRAMRRIQTIALDLFDADGYEQTTIERIAAEAEVSPSSVYRYFGTKEQLVIWDEYDPSALAALMEELGDAPPLEALRRVVRAIMEAGFAADRSRIHRRMRIAFTNPSVEAASTLQTYEMAQLMTTVLADRLARDVDDLEVQVFAHAFTGALLGALRHWYASDFATPFEQVIEAPFDVLERGVGLRAG